MASNLPSGWEAFQILRQMPAPYRPKRHGLWRHGRYSAEGIARRRQAREFFAGCGEAVTRQSLRSRRPGG